MVDRLMSRVLHKKYSDIVLPNAVVDVAVGHFSIAERAIEALRELHPGLRILAIARRDGMVWIDVDTVAAVYPPDISDRVLSVVHDAQTLSAWTCMKDGLPGWLVMTPTGAQVLCAVCQKAAGLEVKKHVV
jgi:hypothetical protein